MSKKVWCFTFGQNQRNIHGTMMKDYWVKVVGGNYGQARAAFIEEFAKPLMGDSARWAFQYGDKFDSSYFPKGEFAKITIGRGKTTIKFK